jgi:hypothetical protein
LRVSKIDPEGWSSLPSQTMDLRAITAAVSSSWPALPPHKGNRPDLAYHMTVVRTADDRVRSDAREAIAAHLPLRVSGTEMWASAGSVGRGLHHALVVPAQRAPDELPAE